MRREHLLLLLILLLGAGLRLYSLRNEYFTGNDAFIHYSVIRQALVDGNLVTYELSYGNPVILEPLGFYLVTLIPSFVLGLDIAFLLMPVLSGVLCLLVAYYLLRDLFGERAALIAVLLLSLSMAHIYRTSANTYRGDGFFLTAFLLTLYYFNKSLKASVKYSVVTGLLMTLCASLWNGYPLGVIVIISGLIINSTLKFLKNDFAKKDLTNIFALLVTYYFTELILILTGVTKRLFFTSNNAVHAVITFAPLFIGVIYYFTKRVKKSSVLGVLAVVGVVLLLLNINTVSSLVAQSLFENTLFYEVGVSELLPPTFDLLSAMLSWSLFLMWPGLLLLVLLILKKRDARHITFLVWSVITIYLMLNYSRYNFIVSVSAAALSALFINYLYLKAEQYRKNAGLVLVLVLVLLYVFVIPLTGSVTNLFNNLNSVSPRVNAEWADALTWMRDNLEPDLTVTWWDHGSWVQYFAGFPTIADSVTGQDIGRITRVAQFLMTAKNDTFSDLGAKYLVLGADDVLYSNAIVSIADVRGFEMYGLDSGYFQSNDDELYFISGDLVLAPRFVFFANQSIPLIESNGTGCLMINYLEPRPYLLFLNDYACNTNYAQLMFGLGLPGFELLYQNDYVVVYRIE
ncbi:MAG: STT3 domain-containing protein [Candidatus Nanoarchaeia archaeon]|jgi:dolichyl-diphosphooligosaccharide--protein glycosyltransferase